MIELEDLPKIGKKRLECFHQLKIFTVTDLLMFFPRKYEDRRSMGYLASIKKNHSKSLLVNATVLKIVQVNASNKTFPKVYFTDGQTEGVLVGFNRSYLKDSFSVGDSFLIYGTFENRYQEIQTSQFEIYPLDSVDFSLDFKRIVPIYPLTEGLTQKLMRAVIYSGLEKMTAILKDPLPKTIVEKYGFLSFAESLRHIHFPDSIEAKDEAKRRFKYQEAYSYLAPIAEKTLAFQRRFDTNTIQETRSISNDGSYQAIQSFIHQLPFQLTEGQSAVWTEIQNDLHSAKPMRRLLQGDVGSGKTLVSILAVVDILNQGGQVAFMVPTEVLARQHFKTLSMLLKHISTNIRILTGSTTGIEKEVLFQDIRKGIIQVVVGTQTLFNEHLKYQNLRLVIIDEQHKFGVQERFNLLKKGKNPHLLIMTATPIPRTLALTFYSDLDVSIIPDKPANRVPIKTVVRYNKDHLAIWNRCKQEVQQGNQGFIIFPIIDESEKISARSIESTLHQLTKHLGSECIGVLHGRMDSSTKDRLMQDFVDRRFSILVSTTVIEVGIDVPNATFIIIESADRFGISQLHQLRGRIGRGSKPGTCFLLVGETITEEGKERMRAMVKTTSGFLLADLDLRMRGPGELLGNRQAGIPRFKLIDWTKDEDFIKQVRKDVYALPSNTASGVWG